ncbi:hypothetical protein JMN32_27190, partial [Fulvivirga sp. 29W222]
KQLDSHGLQYLGEAKKLEDWEIENEEDWKKRTDRPDGIFTYELQRPYGQGSNPTSGFKEYKEPSPAHAFGLVIYSRPLKDKEKYNYSLVPVFEDASEPYSQWKAAIEKTAIHDELLATLKAAKNKPIESVIETLGAFILNNAHEDGNLEFVFGRYGIQELGMAAYEALIGKISFLDELIMQLKIELELA